MPTRRITRRPLTCLDRCCFKSYIEMNVMLATTILKMYGKCGSLRDAHVIFGWLQHRDLVSWTVMITEYARQGRSHEAFMLFRQMEEEGIKPNVVTFTGMLNAYSTAEALEEGKLGHASIIYNGLNLDIVLGTALFSMYERCGSMWDAKRLFDSTPNKNAVSWTALIAAYVERGQGKQAVQMFREMGRQKLKPNEVTFVHILSVCSNSEGRIFHGQVIRDELRPGTVLINALISMYGRGGSIEEALHLFNKLEERSVVSWNALIVAYSQNGDVQSAHRTFNHMPCHTLVSWTALIGAYAQHGYSKKSLQLFKNLYIGPDKVVFVSVIEACCNGALYSDGKIIHANILARGWELDTIIGTALVNMYGKCASLYDALFMFERMLHQNVIAWNTIIAVNAKYGSFEKACLIFHDMPHKDIVSWTTMILASAEYGYSEESIQLYYQMLQENIPPNKVTFVSVVDACTRLESLTKGILIHLDIVRHGFDSDVIVKTALLNMYGKCGLLGDARQMFDELPKRNVVSFTAMIAAYAQHGLAKEALELFYEMQQDGIKPNEITFLSILSACSHSGLWDNGQHCFVSMCADYGILPLVDHYYSLLNLISHVGWFNEAEDFVSEMPFQATCGAWRTLLSACTNHGNLELGKYAAGHMVNLNPLDTTAYVLLSNIYAIDFSWADELGLQWESMVHEMFH